MIFEGLEKVDAALTSEEKKLGFVCIWFSFAFALFLLNRFGVETVDEVLHCDRFTCKGAQEKNF